MGRLLAAGTLGLGLGAAGAAPAQEPGLGAALHVAADPGSTTRAGEPGDPSRPASASNSLTPLPLARRLGLPDPLPIGRATAGMAVAGESPERDGLASRSAAPAAAREPPPAVLLLVDAARATLGLSPEVEGATARAESARLQQAAAAGAFRPRAELRLSAGRGQIDPDGAPEALRDRTDHALVLRQRLVDTSLRHEQRRQQRLSEAAQRWRDSAEAQALADTGNALLALLTAEAGLRVARDHEHRLLTLSSTLRSAQPAGAQSPQAAADRDRVDARLANVRSQLSDGRAAVLTAARNVERLTGRPAAALGVADLLDPRRHPSADLPTDVAAGIAALLQSNAELQARQLEAEAVSAEAQSLAGRRLPRLELEAGRFRLHNPGGFPGGIDDTRATATLVVPLASGGVDPALERAARAREADARAQQRSAEGRLRQELEAAYGTMAANTERLGSVAAELDGNDRLVATLEVQPYGPRTSVNDRLDALERQAQSRTDLLQVQVTLTKTRWRLAQLTGHIVPLFLGPDAPTLPR